MKSDRELLVLAARAFGFGVECSRGPIWTESEYPKKSGKNGALWNGKGGWGDEAELWNPLTDDGDALRLAVRLWLDLNINDGQCDVFSSEGFYNCRDDDTAAATRRAIVRAAAAIGEAME